jgi:quinol monooxygenase YgiN
MLPARRAVSSVGFRIGTRVYIGPVIIVSGWLRVLPEQRQGYLDGCRAVVEAARQAPGCIEFHLGADPLDPERIVVFEQWASATHVDDFRAAEGPQPTHLDAIVDAHVEQHDVARSTGLT